ncbi:unnamed protein product [Didymodactylos carnosus]|uniref:Rhodanese domain-containing protein n=1 Tax=Didymodactylos carnosus TaxID=1234261 RepID=A0A814INP6_9BILA|nr:unnamed protein product [Didymodactylos carnosus]CAF1026408.1 unnamed protein product [Didymodactylos carnosus]CAF3666745.1 unnamed protein product [Didymodactylos carnosus]CAF3797527.1 unnamed protein product [Didymodactylos carnosus]
MLSLKLPGPIVTHDWLMSNFDRVKIIDGSWHLPSENRNAKAEFEQKRIKGARFFDIDEVSDHSTDLPHMLPSVEQFSSYASQQGINEQDSIIIYDTKGLLSSARVWFTFRVFGIDNVAVLNGGLPIWLKYNLPTESGVLEPKTATKFSAKPKWYFVKSMKQMRENLLISKFQVIDARSTGRFNGSELELRPNLPSGHIPNSLSIPYNQLVSKSNSHQIPMLKDDKALLSLFHSQGVKIGNQCSIVATCGSGISACVLALSLELLGHKDWQVYDGSWTEWASNKDNPISKGDS